MQVHPVFHVSLLKRYRDDGNHYPPPPEVVDGILGHKEVKVGRGKIRKYLVKWHGYGPEEIPGAGEKPKEQCHAHVQRWVHSRLGIISIQSGCLTECESSIT
eukprot:jgi/Chrzof1/6053/Cz17g07010.t1